MSLIHGIPKEGMCDNCNKKETKYGAVQCSIYSIEGVNYWCRLGGKCPMNSEVVSIDHGIQSRVRVGQQKQRKSR